MKWLATAVTIAVGLVTLLDFFFQHPLLNAIGITFREWTILLTAFALLLGLGNLVSVHLLRIFRRSEPGAGYSAIVLISFVVVTGTGLWFGITSPEMGWVFDNIYVPLQSAFFALVAFFLATAGYRALRARNVETVLMLLAALIVFLGQVPLWPFLNDAREWVLSVPAEAGVRGILLGVGLGTMATGFRLIVGLDRPHSE